jgi:hypothetical protein
MLPKKNSFSVAFRPKKIYKNFKKGKFATEYFVVRKLCRLLAIFHPHLNFIFYFKKIIIKKLIKKEKKKNWSAFVIQSKLLAFIKMMLHYHNEIQLHLFI